MAKLGFEYLVVARIDYKEKDIRKEKKELEFIWYPTWSLDRGQTKIFTYISHDHYSVDYKVFKNFLEEYNLKLNNYVNKIKLISEKAVEYFQNITKWYKTDHIFFFYGDDFTFQKANVSNINLEYIMDNINNNAEFNSTLRMEYSTPTKYFAEIKKEYTNWPTYKDNDFFPYADKSFVYWTGFFTTRPYLKGLIRDAGKYLSNISKLMINELMKDRNPV